VIAELQQLQRDAEQLYIERAVFELLVLNNAEDERPVQ